MNEMIEMQLRMKALEAQITELQANQSRLITEQRMYRLRYEAAQKVLQLVLVDLPIASKLYANEEVTEDKAMEMLASAKELHERIDLLEKDAWTQVVPLVREFLTCGKMLQSGLYRNSDGSAVNEARGEFLDEWIVKFRNALG